MGLTWSICNHKSCFISKFGAIIYQKLYCFDSDNIRIGQTKTKTLLNPCWTISDSGSPCSSWIQTSTIDAARNDVKIFIFLRQDPIKHTNCSYPGHSDLVSFVAKNKRRNIHCFHWNIMRMHAYLALKKPILIGCSNLDWGIDERSNLQYWLLDKAIARKDKKISRLIPYKSLER